MAVWSLIPFNETLETERLDAEHYQPKYLAAELAVSKVPHLPLKQLAASIKRGVQPVYDELGTVPVLRSVNVQNGGLSGNRQLHVSQELFDKAARGQTRQHDVLLTSTGVGTLGRAAALDTMQPYFADGHITIIRGLSRITPFYLSVFLMSETGQLLIYRRHRGSSGQIEIYPDDIASIPVPIPPIELLQELEQLQQARVEAVERSNALYNEAEALLLHELGLDQLQLPTAKTYTAPFAEVMAAERMDAEFSGHSIALFLTTYAANLMVVRSVTWAS